MAQRLAAAVREAVELYPQLSAFDEGADPTHAAIHALQAPLRSMPLRIAAAIDEAPGRPLPASLVTKLVAMLRDAGRRETNSTRANFTAMVISLLLNMDTQHIPDETRTAQLTVAPGFLESLAAAIVLRAALSDTAAAQLTIVAAAVTAAGRLCGSSDLLKANAALINAPGDLISAISSVAKTRLTRNPAMDEANRSAALRVLCAFCYHHVPAAARCVADSGLVDQALAHARHGDPTFRNVAINLLALLADTDHPDVGDRFLSGPQAEAAVAAALSCLRRPFRADGEHANTEGLSLAFASNVLGAIFRNPKTTPAAVRAAAQGAAALVTVQQLKEAATDWASWVASEALCWAANCDAAWDAPLPAEAQGWWARHLEAGAGTNDDDPLFYSGNSLNATRTAATLARRGGAMAKLAWQAVEQRPAVLDTLRLQLAEFPPRQGRPSAPEDTSVQLHLLTTPVGELLYLLTSQATLEQRRVMIRRRHFLSGLAKIVFKSPQIIAGGAVGLAAANAMLQPLRAMARPQEEGRAAHEAAWTVLGLQHNQGCLMPRPEWLPASGTVMTDTFIGNLRDAARVLEVLTGTDGADGGAACDALIAACPKEVEELQTWLAAQGSREGHPLFQVSQRLQARKGIPREGGFVPACGCCGATTAALLRCSRCKRIAFCSRECQSKAWKDHKPICQQASTSGSNQAGGPVPTPCTGAIEVSGVVRAFEALATATQQQDQAQQQQEQQQQESAPEQSQQQQSQQQPGAVASEPAAEHEPVIACGTCGKTEAEDGVKLKRCSGCRAPFPKYCSAACYEAAWPGHKAACKAARAAQKQQSTAAG